MEKDLIRGEANEMDWIMHSSVKEILKESNTEKNNAVLKALKEGSEYMVIRDYKNSDEYEYSVIEKCNNEYRFITDVSD